MDPVSTSFLYSIPLDAVTSVEKQLADAETESTTGYVANPAESLGSQYGLDLKLQAEVSTLTNWQSANTIVQSQLTASQNVLSSISSDAQNFQNDLLGAVGSGDVSTLQTEAQSFLSSLVSDLNTTAGGSYLFGGTNNTVAPMADDSAAAQQATADAFQTAFGVAISGAGASSITATDMQAFLTGPFASLFTGSNWTTNWSSASSTPTSALIAPGQTVTTSATANDTPFQELVSAYVSVSDLGLSSLNSSTQTAVLNNAVSLVGSALQGITNSQSTLGISQSQITSVNSQMQTQSTFVTNWINQLAGVNAYQAASDLTNLTTQLETAYSLTDRISKLGLVNYLST